MFVVKFCSQLSWLFDWDAMNQALTVLDLLVHNGGTLKESVAFNLGHIQSMEAFVENHLATGQQPVGRGELNAMLISCGQERTNSGSRAVGFCCVVFAYHILHQTSPHLFLSTDEFMLKYPEYAINSTAAEVDSALTMCNMTIAALRILKGEKNKAAFVEIVTRICSGPEANVITGGGKVGDEKRTLPAENFYVVESGIAPEKTKKGTKRSLAEVKSEDESPFPSSASAAVEVRMEPEMEEQFCHLSPQGTLSMPVGKDLPLLGNLSPLLRGSSSGSDAGAENESNSSVF